MSRTKKSQVYQLLNRVEKRKDNFLTTLKSRIDFIKSYFIKRYYFLRFSLITKPDSSYNELKFYLKRDKTLVIILIITALTIYARDFKEIMSLNISGNIANLLPTLIQAIASIMSIIIAVVLVAFEIQRRLSAGLTVRYFLNNRHVRGFFALYVSTLIISIIALATLEATPSLLTIKLAYLAIGLSIYALFRLYFDLRKMFSEMHIKSRSERIVGMIEVSHTEIFGYDFNSLVNSNYLEAVEHNTLFVLTEMAVNLLRERDTTSALYIVSGVLDKLIKILDENFKDFNYERRGVIKGFLFLFSDVADEALKQGNSRMALFILHSFKKIHSYYADNKYRWSEMGELNNAIFSLLNEAIQVGMNELVTDGIYALEHIMEFHLEKNIPDAKDIWEMKGGELKSEDKSQIKSDYNLDLQWDHVSSEYVRMIASLIENSLKNKNTNVLGFSSLTFLSNKVLDMSNLTVKQKQRIVFQCYYYVRSLAIKGIDAGVWGKTSVPDPFHMGDVYGVLHYKKEFAKRILTEYGEYLIELAHRRMLDEFVLNEFGSIGRGCVRDINEDNIYHQALHYILRVFDVLRKEIEKDDSLESNKVYLELYDQINSFSKWSKDLPVANARRLKGLINKYKNRFRDINKVKGVQGSLTAEWPEPKPKKQS